MKRTNKLTRDGAPDRGIYNSTYLMILLNGHLAQWAKEHKLTTTISKLMFVMQIESEKLDDVFLTLVYDDGVNETSVAAGYIGQNLTDVEDKYCQKLPFFTDRDLIKTPPYEVITNGKLKDLDDSTGILHQVALGFHNLMVDTCNLSPGITAALANNNGSAILFLRDNEEYVTKIEFYLKDIIKFISNIEQQRTTTIRNSIKSLINKEKV